MSKKKDYVLDIVPPLTKNWEKNLNAVKLSVRKRKLDFILIHKKKLVLFFLSISIILLLIIVSSNVIENQKNLTKIFSKNQNQNVIFLLSLFFLFIVLMRQEAIEEVIVLKGIGIQLVSRHCWKFLFTTSTFVSLHNINDIVIHEGFHGYGQVIFYLSILTIYDLEKKTDKNLVKVVFSKFLPRKEILITTWKISREILFGELKKKI